MPLSATRSETVYRIRNNGRDPFRYTPDVDPTLEIIGLLLWVTEGDRTQLSLSNGNPSIVKKYVKFLRRVCNFDEQRIKAVIHCHDSLPYNQCQEYWSGVTGIPPGRFTKPFLKPDRGGHRKYPYGIVRIVANNIKLIQHFKERLQAFGLDRP